MTVLNSAMEPRSVVQERMIRVLGLRSCASGCPELAKTEYIKRHNNAAAYMHWKILKHYNIKANDKWYEHQPETVTENGKVTMLWDMQVHTDKTIKAKKPDIIIKDKQEKTCMLIDMATLPTEIHQ